MGSWDPPMGGKDGWCRKGGGGSTPRDGTLRCSSPARRKGKILWGGGRESRHRLLADVVLGFIFKVSMNGWLEAVPPARPGRRPATSVPRLLIKNQPARAENTPRTCCIPTLGERYKTESRETPKSANRALPQGFTWLMHWDLYTLPREEDARQAPIMALPPESISLCGQRCAGGMRPSSERHHPVPTSIGKSVARV